MMGKLTIINISLMVGAIVYILTGDSVHGYVLIAYQLLVLVLQMWGHDN